MRTPRGSAALLALAQWFRRNCNDGAAKGDFDDDDVLIGGRS